MGVVAAGVTRCITGEPRVSIAFPAACGQSGARPLRIVRKTAPAWRKRSKLTHKAEPMVLSVPEMEPERFYHLQLIDLYTTTTPTWEHSPPGRCRRVSPRRPRWEGETPDGIAGVIRSETDLVFSTTGTQLFGPNDLENVKQIQAGYRLESLSRFVGTEAPPTKPLREFVAWTEGAQRPRKRAGSPALSPGRSSQYALVRARHRHSHSTWRGSP